jgi:sugar lactone lactonase YvrE
VSVRACPLAILAVVLTCAVSHRVPSTMTSATSTSINGPTDLAIDGHGNLFVTERIENRIRRVDLRRGTISTAAGNGKECCDRDGIIATEASLDFPNSLAVDAVGNLFIGEGGKVRRVDASTGLISTVAGSDKTGNTIEGSVALSAEFKSIDDLVVDGHGNLFIADGQQDKVFKVNGRNGTVLRVAGNGKQGYSGDGGLALNASFKFASSIGLGKNGDLIIADFENCRIRVVEHETGIVKTVAVTGGPPQNCSGTADNSRPGPFPSNPVADAAGNIYFAEGAMDIVQRIDAASGKVSVFAGTGEKGFSGDGGPATDAQLSNPSGLVVDSDGNVFIAEYVNNRVRRVDAKTRVITTVAGNGLPHRIDVEM